MSFRSEDVEKLVNLQCRWAAIVVLCSASTGLAKETDTSVFRKPVPQGAADLRVIEQTATAIAKQVIPCTVGLEIRAGRGVLAQGSGVIVSEDGYILTAAHVIGAPGRDAQISLSNGKVLRGKTLGIHALADIGLVKITDQGDWSFAPLVPANHGPAAGDWCLVTGHPSGFQAQRDAPVRLGRIIDIQQNVLRTDCPLTGGDSGGPLFDMKGRVVGIHSRIASDVTENLHGPVLACLPAWEQLEAGEVYPERSPSRFLDQLDIDRDGSLTRSELPDEFRRRVFDRLVEKFDLDPKEAHSIESLTSALGWRKLTTPILNPVNINRERIGQSLSRRSFVRGREVRAAFGEVASQASDATVRVECEGKRVGLGVVVRTDGWIVTKASQLNGDARCKLSDGRVLPATVVGVDSEYDLAVLKIDADDLAVVAWSSNVSDLEPGSWLVTPGIQGEVASVGVLSVGAREITGFRAVLGVQLTGEDVARIANVLPNSGAAEAGIMGGDVITHVMGHAVANVQQIHKLLQDYRAGDVITTRITRGDETLEIDVTLGAPEDIFFRSRRGSLGGPLSRRRDTFPQVLQHDTVLHPTMCGGPIIDLSGKAVGINIARADRVASYAVPAEIVEAFVQTLESNTAAPPKPAP